MTIGLDIELSFTLDSESEDDLFLFVKSRFNKNEVDFIGLSYEQILRESFKMATTEDERAELKTKIRQSMTDFLEHIDRIK